MKVVWSQRLTSQITRIINDLQMLSSTASLTVLSPHRAQKIHYALHPVPVVSVRPTLFVRTYRQKSEMERRREFKIRYGTHVPNSRCNCSWYLKVNSSELQRSRLRGQHVVCVYQNRKVTESSNSV